MNEQQKLYPWFEGQPTAPDVSKLLKAYSDLKVGDAVSHQDVENVIGEKWKSLRYQTVTSAWRRRLHEEQGLNIDCQQGKGFYVATFDQVAAGTYTVFNRHVRATKRQFKRLSVTKYVLSDQQKVVREHQRSLLENSAREAKKTKMNILPLTATQPTPQICPPEQEKSR